MLLLSFAPSIELTGSNGNGLSIGDSSNAVYAATKKVTVKFNANGGKTSKKSKKVTYNVKIGKLPKATRANYTFKGWYTKKSGGKKYTTTTKVTTKKLTLYAQWKKKSSVPKDDTDASAPKDDAESSVPKDDAESSVPKDYTESSKVKLPSLPIEYTYYNTYYEKEQSTTIYL
jgi:uncharacterized repeat protein (TIGR02543 family)